MRNDFVQVSCWDEYGFISSKTTPAHWYYQHAGLLLLKEFDGFFFSMLIKRKVPSQSDKNSSSSNTLRVGDIACN
jgi:hypothetical protein